MPRVAFLDTNVLLDVAMSERPGWAAATLLMDEFAYDAAQGCVAASSLKDIYYVLSKYATEPDARAFITAVMDLFRIIPVDEAICRMAALSDEPDFEDAIIRACAESVQADCIISRDEKAFRRSTIKRLSPQEYLDLFCDVETISLDEEG